MADEYPNCVVIGTDLSPIQPSWCPPNVKFEIDDLEQPWTYAPNSFDYIHIRYMVGGVSDWNKLFRQAYGALKPGGWIESFEVEADYRSDDNTIPPNSAMHIWQDLFTEGGKKLGRPFTILTEDTQRKGIEAAGFVDITVKDIKVSHMISCVECTRKLPSLLRHAHHSYTVVGTNGLLASRFEIKRDWPMGSVYP